MLADGDPESLRTRRREELIESATMRGVDPAVAERALDLAHEEGLHPAAALGVLEAGAGVSRPAEVSQDAPAAHAGRPDWIEEPPPLPAARSERVMRETFRRLRHLIQESGSTEDGLRALALEPDLSEFHYR